MRLERIETKGSQLNPFPWSASKFEIQIYKEGEWNSLSEQFSAVIASSRWKIEIKEENFLQKRLKEITAALCSFQNSERKMTILTVVWKKIRNVHFSHTFMTPLLAEKIRIYPEAAAYSPVSAMNILFYGCEAPLPPKG